ncbi:MAG: glutamate-1-semialdehyde 2,1-aminomutase [Candidatus Rifleibacteriota bacterium]
MNSAMAFEQALKVFPGGVNSPVRAFGSVGGKPVFVQKGKGSKIFSVDGKEYIDFVGSWGPMILGHADEDVIEAVIKAATNGLSFGAPTEAETLLANLIQKAFPGMEMMRFVSSGTEAVMSAIRLARGFTERPLIIKCEGAYHGHADSLLVSAGSGVATLAIPGCPGIPDGIAGNTLVIPYNDSEALEECFKAYPGQVACFIVEPVCGNMGVVNPEPGYLKRIRELCTKYGSLLIFDEVMTGFRACFGGVSTLSGVTPDLTCLGKIVGGGLPLAVYGGRREIMKHIAPEGPVYQAGTLSGNPVAVAAGIATLQKISSDSKFYQRLTEKSETLERGLNKLAKEHSVAVVSNRFGSMITMFFTNETRVCSYADARKSDTNIFAHWFRMMLERGIYLAPSQFEAAFVSIAHDQADIDRTLEAAEICFRAL